MATIKSIAQQKGWEYQKNYMYGKEDNYLITARQVIDLMQSANNCKLVYIPLLNITQEQAVQTLEYLKENKKELKVSAFEFSNHVLVMRLQETLKGYSVENFDNLIRNLVSFLRRNEIAYTPTCIYCNNTDVDSVMKIDKVAYHSHQECITKAQGDLVQAKENFKSANKNYGKGMIGALLGAVIGAIPWMLLEWFWGYAAILSLLIGYGAFYGYKKFGGLVTKLTKWFMLIAIFFAILVSNFATVTFAFITNDIPLTILNYISAYTNEEIGAAILESLGIGALFGLLGFISVYRKVKAEEFNSVIE